MSKQKWGLECGIPNTVVPENGTLIQLAEQPVRIIESIPVGRLGYDGNRMIPMMSLVIRDRARLGLNGLVVASLVLDRVGQLAKTPQITLLGVCNGGEEQELVERDIHRQIRQTLNNNHRDQNALKEELRQAIRRVCNNCVGKKPVTEVHVFE